MYSEGIDIHATTFTYGADGLRRSMKVGNNPAVHYLLNGQSVAQEGHLDGSSVFTPDVTYFSGIRGPECRYDHSSEKTIWYIYDGLGSVVGELEADGIAPSGDYAYAEVTATRKFDVYGLPRAGGTGTSATNHGFVGSLGHASEADTGGLIYMRARYYDPALGRFISEDPAGDGVNWFVYCRNNPVNFFDADGRLSLGNLSLGFAIGETLLGMGFNVALQYAFKGQVCVWEVALAGAVSAVGAGYGHHLRYLHYARTTVGRRAWVDAGGSFSSYFQKFLGIGTGTSKETMTLWPIKRALTSAAGARAFSFAYNSYIASYLE